MPKRKAPPKPRPRGRPSPFTPALASELCARIASGRSLRSVCLDADMPGMTTVFRWMPDHPAFRQQYDEAIEARAQVMFDELVELADTPFEGETVVETDDGRREVKRGDMLGHRRLQVDTRKWILARMSPRKYGDKVGVEHSGTVSLEALVLGSMKRDDEPSSE
jgi:hypothetical protein